MMFNGKGSACVKMVMSPAVLTITLWLTAGSLLRPDQPLDTIIQRVERHYNKAQTLTVDFTESYAIQGHRRPLEAGKLTLRKQGKMRWDYTQPSGKVFVSDGKIIYLYTAADNRVEKIPLKEADDMRAPLAFLLGHLDLKKEFRDFQMRTEGGRTLLEANALSDKTPYSRIQMQVDAAGGISRLLVFGRDDSSIQFELSHEKVNSQVSDSLFSFQIPLGAEVVDGLQYAGEGR